jgi:hypothetical protein
LVMTEVLDALEVDLGVVREHDASSVDLRQILMVLL